jgi:transcriptional regulator with XRE-family HTH domain
VSAGGDPSPDYDAIVTELIARRNGLGLSQREITRRLGTSSATVSQWERGTNQPTLSRLRAWARSLGYDLALAPTDPDGWLETARAVEAEEYVCEACDVVHDPLTDQSLGMVCGRCNQHTGNYTQGHYWGLCKVELGRGKPWQDCIRDLHFCCPGDCALESTRSPACPCGCSTDMHIARTNRR